MSHASNLHRHGRAAVLRDSSIFSQEIGAHTTETSSSVLGRAFISIYLSGACELARKLQRMHVTVLRYLRVDSLPPPTQLQTLLGAEDCLVLDDGQAMGRSRGSPAASRVLTREPPAWLYSTNCKH
jgi:hypothetical protein